MNRSMNGSMNGSNEESIVALEKRSSMSRRSFMQFFAAMASTVGLPAGDSSADKKAEKRQP